MEPKTIECDPNFTHEQWEESIDAMRACISTHLENGWEIYRNFGLYTFMFFPDGSYKVTSEMIAITIGGHVAVLKSKEEDCMPAWIDGDSC